MNQVIRAATARPRVVSRVFGSATVAGIAAAARPRSHDLRHTHAPWLISDGASMSPCSAGCDNSFNTSSDVYGHLTPRQATAPSR